MAKVKTPETPAVSKRAAFFTLLGAALDDLPRDAVDKTVRKFEDVPAKRADLVLQGKTADIEILVKIIRTCVPGFVFPSKVSDFLSF